MTVLEHQRVPVVDVSITSVQQNKFSSDKTDHKFREYVPSADSFDKLTTVAKTYFLMHKYVCYFCFRYIIELIIFT